MILINWFKSYFSLEFVQSEFMDVVSGKQVCRYRDCFGDEYLKDSRWSTFRCKSGYKVGK